MDLSDVLLSPDEIGYATHLLETHFGPNAARVAGSLLARGPTCKISLRELVALVNDPKWNSAGPTLVVAKLSPTHVRAALVLLMHHHVVVPSSRESDGKVLYSYRASVEGILARGRFSHYLELVVREFGELGAHIFSEVLQHGSIFPDSFSIPDGFVQADVDELVAELRKKRWLRVVDLDATHRKSIDLTEEGRMSALRSNFRVLNLALANTLLGKLIEDQLGAASGLVFTALFRAVVSIDKDDVLRFNPQVVENIIPFVHGHLSSNDVTNYLRSMGSESVCAGIIVTCGKETVAENRTAIPVVESRKKRAKVVAPPPVPEVPTTNVREAFSVDWKAVRRKVQREFSRLIVRQQFGTQAARVYAVLDDNCEKMFEVDQISHHCLLTRKDVCVILNQLTLMNLVFWQEIPKGQHSALCTPANVPNYGVGIWVYQANKEKSAANFRSLMAKSLHNLMQRFKDEVEGRAVIPPKMDRVALDSAQDILERTFCHLQLTYLALRDI